MCVEAELSIMIISLKKHPTTRPPPESFWKHMQVRHPTLTESHPPHRELAAGLGLIEEKFASEDLCPWHQCSTTMSSRGSTRGGTGARSNRGGRGASATAAVPSTRPSIEGNADGAGPATNAPISAAAHAVTIDSSLSATNSPTPAPSVRGGRFKPRAVRRDATERQKLEDERSRDLAAKIKVEEKEQRDADRRARRGGRGRGRGDAGFIRRTVTAGGAFSGIGQGMRFTANF